MRSLFGVKGGAGWWLQLVLTAAGCLAVAHPICLQPGINPWASIVSPDLRTDSVLVVTSVSIEGIRVVQEQPNTIAALVCTSNVQQHCSSEVAGLASQSDVVSIHTDTFADKILYPFEVCATSILRR
jgi:hypothetical protein